MMRIAFLSQYEKPGGIRTVLFELGRRLAKKHRVFIFSVKSTYLPPHEFIDNIDVYRYLDSRYLKSLTFNTIQTVRLIKRHKIDIIHSISAMPLLIYTATLSKLLTKIPLIVTVHGTDVLFSSIGINEVIKIVCLKLADQIVAVSSYTAGLINQYVSDSKITVIPNGVDTTRFNPYLDCKEIKRKHNLTGKVVLTVSRLTERKGIDLAIKAISDLQKLKSTYLVVSDGPLREKLVNLANRLKVNAIFTGYVTDEELPKYYNACDIFVMPSRIVKETHDVEGFGIALLEAAACGKPVVTTRSGGITEAVDNNFAITVKPNSVSQLRGAIYKLLTIETGLAMKNAARKWALAHDWNLILQKYEKLYEELTRAQSSMKIK